MQFQINNRLDIYDPKSRRWLEAHIVEMRAQGSAATGTAIKVHYKSFSSTYDEWIDWVKEGTRIKEVGLFSGAEGFAKHSVRMQQEAKDKEEELKRQLKQY